MGAVAANVDTAFRDTTERLGRGGVQEDTSTNKQRTVNIIAFASAIMVNRLPTRSFANVANVTQVTAPKELDKARVQTRRKND